MLSADDCGFKQASAHIGDFIHLIPVGVLTTVDSNRLRHIVTATDTYTSLVC